MNPLRHRSAILALGLLFGAWTAPASYAQDEGLEAQINNVPAGGSLELEARDYYVDGPIDIQAHGQRVDGNGARFIATAQGYPIFHITGSGLRLEDTTVIGRNQVHKAARPPGGDVFEFDNPTSWEWDHGYVVESASDITLAGVRAYEVWGDGVAVQSAAATPTVPSRDVQIVPSATRAPEFRHVGRNGVSFVVAVDSALRGAVVDDVDGLWAVDLEPDTGEEDVQGITLAGNRLGGSPHAPVNLTGPWFGGGGDGRVFADIKIVDNEVSPPTATQEPSISIEPHGTRVAGLEVTGNVITRRRAGVAVAHADGGVVAGNRVCPGPEWGFRAIELNDTTGIAEYGNGCPADGPTPASPTGSSPSTAASCCQISILTAQEKRHVRCAKRRARRCVKRRTRRPAREPAAEAAQRNRAARRG